MKNITIQLLVGYKDLFDEDNTEVLKRIVQYPLEIVLAELVGINYELRGSTDLYSNMDVNILEKILNKWLDSDRYLQELYDKLNLYSKSKKNLNVTIFNRAACLYGIDFCYRNLKPIVGEFIYTRRFWIDLIQFCLACNDIITQFKSEESSKVTLLEDVNAKQALLNELNTTSNPILIFNRYISLILFLKSNKNYNEYLTKYLASLNLNPESLIMSLFLIYFNTNQKEGLKFFIKLNKTESPDAYSLLQWLSDIKLFSKKHDLDLLSIYKWPVFKRSEEEFIILDVELLLDKVYRQFINDFYFDFLRNEGITYQTYKGAIGMFLEAHIANEFSEVLTSSPNTVYRHTNELIFGNPKKELCDIYIRHKKNIFIGQVKSTNFADDQKFQGTFEFYNGDMERFYKDVGITQLVQSIEWMTMFENEIDSKFNKKTKIFPAVILSDKFFQTPLMPQVLSNEFTKRLSKISHNFYIHDLIVMDVSSVERLKAINNKKGKMFWQILWRNKISGLAPHFNNTLNFMNIKFNPTLERKKTARFLKLTRK